MSSQPSGRVTILVVSEQPHHFRIRVVVFCSNELITHKDSVIVSDHRSCWIMNCNFYPLDIGQFLSMDSEKMYSYSVMNTLCPWSSWNWVERCAIAGNVVVFYKYTFSVCLQCRHLKPHSLLHWTSGGRFYLLSVHSSYMFFEWLDFHACWRNVQVTR